MKETILGTVDDLISHFLYYDRKEDEELKVGDVEKAIINGEITVEEITERFKSELIAGLSK